MGVIKRNAYKIALLLEVTILLIISIFLIGGEWRASLQRQYVNQLSQKFPGINIYIWSIPSSWIPYPWERITSEELTKRLLVESKKNKLDVENRFLYKTSHNVAFEKYLRAWFIHRSMCEILTNGKEKLNQSCSDRDTHTLPHKWKEIFYTYLNHNTYIENSNLYPSLQKRKVKEEKICNLTPLNQEVNYLIKNYMSPKTANVYQQFLEDPVDIHQSSKKYILAAGECRTFNISSYDTENTVLFSSNFTDQNEKIWLQNIWDKFYLKKGSENYNYYYNARNETLAHLPTYCPNITLKEKWYSTKDIECTLKQHSNQEMQYYLPGQKVSQNQNFSVLSLPIFSFLSEVVELDSNNKITGINFPFLKNLQEKSRIYNQRIKTQMTAEALWDGRIPNYFITKNDILNVTDYNGPLERGVYASKIPNRTILDEYVDIPPSGNIISLASCKIDGKSCEKIINPSQVFSQYDLYNALYTHATNPYLGINNPLRVMFDDENSLESAFKNSYLTRYRFNPDAPQQFTKEKSFSDCYFNISWLAIQKGAYSKQVWSEDYKACKFFEAITVGLLTTAFSELKLINMVFNFRSKILSKVLNVAMVEAIAEGFYTTHITPKLHSDEIIRNEILNAIKLGSIVGSASEIIFYKK